MKKKYPSVQNDFEINLSDIFGKLWKDKILIFLICLIFSITSYFYFTSQTKTYKIGIEFSEASEKVFNHYIEFSKELQMPTKDLEINFNNEFREQLLKPDNFAEFVKKNNEIIEFKSYLKDKNIDIPTFFEESFIINYLDKESKKLIIDRIYFIYEKNFLAEKILNEYIIFVKNKTEEIFKRDILDKVIFQIKHYKYHLMLANAANLNEPKGEFVYINNANNSDILFFLGTKILTIKINNLENLLDKDKTLRLNYNPIKKKINPSANFKSPKIYLALSFVLGLFFSLVILFIKSLMKNKSYL
jgi:LPS O-antigen subunit length determinant protein (WzzB/FepE family)